MRSNLRSRNYPLIKRRYLGKKVYELKPWPPNTPECLIYDFSLMPGDIFYWGNNSENILLLDSITNHIRNPFFCNGNNMPILTIENPRVFYFDGGGAFATIWVEGIGSLASLLSSHYGEVENHLQVQMGFHTNYWEYKKISRIPTATEYDLLLTNYNPMNIYILKAIIAFFIFLLSN